MKEYWVNAYFHPFNESKQHFVNPALYDCQLMGKPYYRIHVKMDGGYNKRKSSPKYEYWSEFNVDSALQLKQ